MNKDNKDNEAMSGSVDVTDEFLFNEKHNIPNNPMEFMRKLQQGNKKVSQEALNNSVTPLRFLISKKEVDGDMVATLTDEQIQELRSTYNNYVRHREKLNKIYAKRQALNTRAGKLLKQILDSRKEKLDPGKTSLGIYREDGTLYIGSVTKVHADPEAAPNPLLGDRVIGKLTKVEDRKISEISVGLQETEGDIKLGETEDSQNRIKVLELYFILFGEQFMRDLLNSGVRLDTYEFIINTVSKNVRIVQKY